MTDRKRDVSCARAREDLTYLKASFAIGWPVGVRVTAAPTAVLPNLEVADTIEYPFFVVNFHSATPVDSTGITCKSSQRVKFHNAPDNTCVLHSSYQELEIT